MANRYVWEKWNRNSSVKYSYTWGSTSFDDDRYNAYYYESMTFNSSTGKFTLNSRIGDHADVSIIVANSWSGYMSGYVSYSNNIYSFTADYIREYQYVAFNYKIANVTSTTTYTKGSTSYGDVILC